MRTIFSGIGVWFEREICGFALGRGAVSHLTYACGCLCFDIIVSIGDLIGRNPFIADVVGILLIIFRGAAAEEVMGVRTNL